MRLILVLDDDLAALRVGDPAQDIIVKAEAVAEATPVPHPPQKIALVLTAVLKFAARLRESGFRVAYSRLDDPDTGHSLPAELLRRMAETGADQVVVTTPGDWRLLAAPQDVPLPLHLLPDDRFLCPPQVFAAWAADRKSLRMEWIYRDVRRRTGC